jgi:hypothetical protein
MPTGASIALNRIGSHTVALVKTSVICGIPLHSTAFS